MPEPRETHTAIDARRNARGGASEREAPRWTPLSPGMPPNVSYAGRRALCPHCGRKCAVTSDDLLWVHDATLDGIRRLCPGAHLPLDAAPSDPATDTGGEGDG